MVLVTGATGMVGGNLIWYLLQNNDRITALRRQTSNLQPLKLIFDFYTNQSEKYLSRIDWIYSDILDEEAINNACKNIDIVYHCAAVVALGSTSDNLSDINIKGTKNIVNACLKNNVSKLCFVSSIAACGSSLPNNFITEETIWHDTPSKSLYSKSKFYSEQEIWSGIKNGLKAVIVNPGVILGVSGTSTGSSELFYRVRKGLPFYTNGGSGYIDVRDVVNIMISLTNSNITGERYILIAENCSNKEILDYMAVGFGRSKPYIHLNYFILNTIGFISEIINKIFALNIPINRNFAKTASKREFYSNTKIINHLNYNFLPIKKSIIEICDYINKSS